MSNEFYDINSKILYRVLKQKLTRKNKNSIFEENFDFFALDGYQMCEKPFHAESIANIRC